MNSNLTALFDDAIGICNELPHQIKVRIRSIGKFLPGDNQYRARRTRGHIERTISRCAIPLDVNNEES